MSQKAMTQMAVDQNGVWRTRFDQLVQVCEECAKATNTISFYRKLRTTLIDITQSDNVAVFLLDQTGGYLVEASIMASCRLDPTQGYYRIPRSMGRIENILRHNSCILTDCEQPDDADYVPQESVMANCCEMMSIPIISNEDTIGLFCALYSHSESWDKDRIEFFQSVGRVIGTIVERSLLQSPSIMGSLETRGQRNGLPRPSSNASFANDCGYSGYIELTSRETKILELVSYGLSNQEIADEMFVSVGNVKKIVSSIMSKLGLDNRVKLAVFAARMLIQ